MYTGLATTLPSHHTSWPSIRKWSDGLVDRSHDPSPSLRVGGHAHGLGRLLVHADTLLFLALSFLQHIR